MEWPKLLFISWLKVLLKRREGYPHLHLFWPFYRKLDQWMYVKKIQVPICLSSLPSACHRDFLQDCMRAHA